MIASGRWVSIKNYSEVGTIADPDVYVYEDYAVTDSLLKVTARDFGPGFTARLNIDGKIFDMTLNFQPSAIEK